MLFLALQISFIFQITLNLLSQYYHTSSKYTPTTSKKHKFYSESLKSQKNYNFLPMPLKTLLGFQVAQFSLLMDPQNY